MLKSPWDNKYNRFTQAFIGFDRERAKENVITSEIKITIFTTRKIIITLFFKEDLKSLLLTSMPMLQF